MTGRASHGHTRVTPHAKKSRGSRTYTTWLAMRNRCGNVNNDNYDRYGGVGVEVDPTWQNDFDKFIADMGERPEGMTLDRIDGTLNYSKDNCRWATPTQQAENSDNHSKGWRRNNTHCPNGHLFNTENTAVRVDKRTGKEYRKCRACEIEHSRVYRAKRMGQ